MQCSNNFKQIGIGVHNFHDTQQGLPPIVIYASKSSVFGLIYPYIEQVNLYERMKRGNGPLVFPNGVFPDQWFMGVEGNNYTPPPVGLDDEERRAFSSVSIYLCPTRRAGAQMAIRHGAAPGNTGKSGPRSDYAAVVTQSGTEWYWMDYSKLTGNGTVNDTSNPPRNQRGALRIADIVFAPGSAGANNAGNNQNQFNDVTRWAPRDTMSWWQSNDGSSNIIVMGEKFIPTFALGNSGTDNAKCWDGSYLYAWTNGDAYNVARNVITNGIVFGRQLRSGETTPACLYNNSPHNCNSQYSWGGIHSGVCLFLVGDGSVQSISTTTSTTIMWYYACVNDGNAVSF
jgi:hypothetical protein